VTTDIPPYLHPTLQVGSQILDVSVEERSRLEDATRIEDGDVYIRVRPCFVDCLEGSYEGFGVGCISFDGLGGAALGKRGECRLERRSFASE